MAKSKSFFGLRTGSTKSLTFQIYRGQQITKDRVTRIANPRSEAQMKQRALIPIVAASRAALKGLIDHSFEGVNYGNDSLKMFSQLNLTAGALQVDSYAPNGFSNPGFAELIVSKGSLGVFPSDQIGCYKNNEDRTGILFKISAEGTSELTFNAAGKDDSAEAIIQQIASWGEKNCAWCAPGNQLTFLTVAQLFPNYGVGNNRVPLSSFDINRILFPSGDTTESQLSAVNGSYKILDAVTEGASDVHLYNKTAQILISYIKALHELDIQVLPTNNPKGTMYQGGAIIRSAYDNGTWKRSTSSISFVGDIEGAYTYEMWRSFYESSGVSAKYLNQGKENTGIA